MLKARWTAIAVSVPVVVIACLLGLYAAWRYVPGDYNEALELDDQIAASDELLRHASALANDARRDGQWRALFTSRQINGWLAVDMPRNHPDLLSEDVHQPRVFLEKDKLRVAFRYGEGPLSTICTVDIGLQTIQTNTVALRVQRVRGGLLPLPIGHILSTLSNQARRAGVPLEWKRVEGDPVAILRLITLEQAATALALDNLEVCDNELYVAGVTQYRELADAPTAADQHDATLRTTRRQSDDATQHR